MNIVHVVKEINLRSQNQKHVSPAQFALAVADLPPQRWAETLRRLDVVQRYRSGTPSIDRALACAAELGLRQRGFYNLVRAFDTFGRTTPPVRRWGKFKGVGTNVEHIMDEEIARDPAATIRDIFERVRKRCNERGLPIPSIGTVDQRRDEAPEQPQIAARLRRACEYVLDGAPLELAIGTGKTTKPAWLYAVIDATEGSILGYQLTGRNAANTSELLAAIPDQHNARILLPTAGAPVISSRREHALMERSIAVDRHAGIDVDRGAGLRAVLGRHLGLVRIATYDINEDAHPLKPVPIAHARAAIDLLLVRSGRLAVKQQS